MNKVLTCLFVFSLAGLSFKLTGQDTQKQKTEEERKGGFAVGGFDNSRKATEATKSMEFEDKAFREESPPPPVNVMEKEKPAKGSKQKEAKQEKAKKNKKKEMVQSGDDSMIRSDSTSGRVTGKKTVHLPGDTKL